MIVERLFFRLVEKKGLDSRSKVVFASRNSCSDLQIAMSLAHNSSSRTEPAATYLRKLSRISINKFCADGQTVLPLSRNYIFASPPTLLTLLIAATSRARARARASFSVYIHLTLSAIWHFFFSSKKSRYPRLCYFSLILYSLEHNGNVFLTFNNLLFFNAFVAWRLCYK